MLHIATEGPLGMAARRFALRNDFPFTTAYHTRFPEYVHARFRLPLSWSYAWLRHFHGPSKGVMAPTQVVVDDLMANGFTNARLWSRGVDTDVFHPQPSKRLDSTPPIFLYVGRVAVEKNVEAFLELDLPGSKWVVGTGRRSSGSATRFPRVNYLGLLDREELAKVYAAADVFVFPSKTDTFGLVLLEAMACGLPVAAYPVTGPRDVIGDSKAGVLHEDLRTACLGALKLDRADARRAGGPVHVARGHRAIPGPPASAQARLGSARVCVIPEGKQSVAFAALNCARGSPESFADPESVSLAGHASARPILGRIPHIRRREQTTGSLYA